MSTKYHEKISTIRGKISLLLENITVADELSLEAFKSSDAAKFKEVEIKLDKIGLKGDDIDNEIIKTFALFGPEAKELRFLVSYLKMTNEIVRIGEGVKKYARRMSEHTSSGCNLESFKPSILLLHKSSVNALKYILECFSKQDECNYEDIYRKVLVEESMNDDLFAVLEKEILNKIIDEKELSIDYVKILGSLRKLERSCDRSVNIANLMMYAEQGGEIKLFN
ncbi:MAG: PhoU family transcriptional regulator [Sulfurimonas sp. RIFOXYB2_FULL_37_5]|jgi:phosphate transport system protein|uniref:phosphate signaling complex PhoU family protein n=1 Tax=unclassified Sulfurimonas TaxID=2623549 RepID=UPI0008D85589|nr:MULTISPECIES: PhoU domain-containing protein [unclassified Sulfurimonas]MDD3854770.1 PhoU domain-containing protein [Sulfurimonas sp.]MDP2894585.1 PhoU domain-containing protein [Sulfurimonas sp.]OHE06390.1 MAG: PhoU family transcriptional regulator [Sulfurimonas sp. RIFOXYB12_FULL_35_9]OHE15927.1 MAG: PhoU family transcriptional regulator [Sulfurimonas sp. RIFOXYB2_FULL_37_5]